MRVFTNIDTIGEETNLQEDVVIALTEDETHTLQYVLRHYKIHGKIDVIKPSVIKLLDQLCEVLP